MAELGSRADDQSCSIVEATTSGNNPTNHEYRSTFRSRDIVTFPLWILLNLLRSPQQGLDYPAFVPRPFVRTGLLAVSANSARATSRAFSPRRCQGRSGSFLRVIPGARRPGSAVCLLAITEAPTRQAANWVTHTNLKDRCDSLLAKQIVPEAKDDVPRRCGNIARHRDADASCRLLAEVREA